jgi:hypothetical protein
MGYRSAFPEVVAHLASSANPAGPRGAVVPALVEDSHAAQAAVPHGQNHFLDSSWVCLYQGYDR